MIDATTAPQLTFAHIEFQCTEISKSRSRNPCYSLFLKDDTTYIVRRPQQEIKMNDSTLAHCTTQRIDRIELVPGGQNKLLQMDQVVSTPHVGSGDWLSRLNMGIEAADCIVKLHRNEWPEGAVVNNILRDDWKW